MIRAIGIDMAFANMGLANVHIQRGITAPVVVCRDLKLVQTTAENGKTVRKSSDDLRRAVELHRSLHAYIEESRAQVIFAEIPTGAQSAAASKYLGAAIGILASAPIPIIQVSPLEVKKVVSGAKSGSVSKEKMIQWATHRWPTAPWLRYSKAGRVSGKGGKVIASWKAGDFMKDNEHLADALGIVAAGIATPEFQQLMVLHATTSASRERPASGRIPLL